MRKLGGKCLVRPMHGYNRQKAKSVFGVHSASRSAYKISIADGVDQTKSVEGTVTLEPSYIHRSR